MLEIQFKDDAQTEQDSHVVEKFVVGEIDVVHFFWRIKLNKSTPYLLSPFAVKCTRFWSTCSS